MPGSAEERRSFHFFSTCSAPHFADLFDSAFWTQGVLQASHANPAIRHAASALGVLHAKFLASERPCVPGDVSDNDLQFALRQCNRSIECLTKQSNDDPETILTACILFVSFASIQGHQLQAINHLQGGLKLLDGMDSSYSSTTDGPQRRSTHPVPLATLRDLFTSFNLQARAVLSDEMLASWVDESKVDLDSFPRRIEDLDTARSLFDGLCYKSISFVQSLDTLPLSTERLRAAEAHHQRLVERLALSKELLADFLARQASMLKGRELVSVKRLELSRHISEIFLSLSVPVVDSGQSHVQSTERPEWIWDTLEPQCAAIVELARGILESSLAGDLSRGTGAKRPSFSIGLGVIIPLFVVATRCRRPCLRREAVRLLLENPRREGIWDSYVTGMVAARGIEIEEEGLGLDGQHLEDVETAASIPESSRLRSFNVVYVGDRRAQVTYLTRAQWLSGGHGSTSVIEW